MATRKNKNLTAEAVKELIQRCKNGETQRSVAESYGICHSLVGYYVTHGGKRKPEVQKDYKKITKEEFNKIKAERPSTGKSYKDYIKIANEKRKAKGWWLFKIPHGKYTKKD